jgi:hypothetical protein
MNANFEFQVALDAWIACIYSARTAQWLGRDNTKTLKKSVCV